MERVGEALAMLKSHGFSPTNTFKRNRTFSGVLICKKGEVKISLEVSDWDFIEYPVIRIQERPSFFSKLMPHLSEGNRLCYLAPGTIVLDRYHPDVALLQCIQLATNLIDWLCGHPTEIQNEFNHEFLNYWTFGQVKPPWVVFFGEISQDSLEANYFILKRGEDRLPIVSQSIDEVVGLAQALGYDVPVSTNCKCWILETDIRPVISESGLPKTVQDLFKWIKSWDIRISNRVQTILEKNKDYLNYTFVTFAIKTPLGILGFGFDHDEMHRQGYRKKPSKYKQYLHSKGHKIPIFRMWVAEFGQTYIHTRNLLSPNLVNKRISVLGCGAIGGYLAQALVRLGAGAGSKGTLTLYDKDTLSPDNLGRHYLGFPSLIEDKSTALAKELKRQFPHLNVEGVNGQIQLSKKILASEIIIDCTGEEAFSETLNEAALGQDRLPTTLYCWINGNGDSVQTLLVDDRKYGCYRCLLEPLGHGHRKERFPVLKTPPTLGYRGCTAFTPYAVSAPMLASSLAVDALLDYLRGNPSPRFRTRFTENHNSYNIKSQNLSRIQGCPACST